MWSSTTRSVFCLEAPREVGRQQRRDLSRRPSKKVSVRIRRRSSDQPVVAGTGIRFVEAPRRRRRVDANVRVVHDLRVAGAELETANEPRGLHRDREDKDAKRIGPFGLKRVRLLQRDDEIGLPELPPFGPLRLRLRLATADCDRLRGAPASAHRRSSAISASLSGCWPTKGPSAGSAFHGGMKRLAVTVAICPARRLASAYVSR